MRQRKHPNLIAGLRWTLLLVEILWLASVGMAGPNGIIKSMRSLTIPEGRSLLLQFSRMKRVEIIEPDLVEVVVASLNELSVYGKERGATTIYVWDSRGIHQLEVTITAVTAADRAIQDLRRVLGAKLTYTAYGESAVVVEGDLSQAEAARARAIISGPDKSEVKIIDLIHTDGDPSSGAEALASSIAKMLGNDLKCSVWPNSTILVQGVVTEEAVAERARKLIAALGGRGVTLVDLIEVNESAGHPPLEEITRAVGPKFRVWQIQGKTVGVEGTVTSQSALSDLGKVLESFSGQAKIVNLVRVVEAKPDINECVATLQSVVGPNFSVRPLDAESIVVEGVALTEDELKPARDALTKVTVPYRVVDLLHIGRPDKRQIVCHVRIVDINKSDMNKLGVNWGQLSIDDNTVSFVDQPWLLHALPSGLGSGPGGVKNALALGAQLDALKQNNRARILAEPNLMVDDGGKATILVGGEIPVPIAQPSGSGSVTVTIEWKSYGVMLEVEPNILENGKRISVTLTPEVSSLDFGNAITVGGFVLPALRSRRASTDVTVSNGDTLLLAGLVQNEQTKTLRKVPFLGDLPIIGKLFRSTSFQSGESELVIMVTPEIIEKPVEPARETGVQPFR